MRLTRRDHGPAIIGHRGASGHAPENTFASFEKAVAMRADMIECDVHLSADGIPVVIHDETLERTTTGTGLVTRCTAEQLMALGVPKLDDLLAWARTRVPVSIEVKNGPLYYEGIVEATLALLRKHGSVESAFVISFDHHALRRAKELEPRLACGALFAARPVDVVALASACGADAVLPHWAFATPDLVEQAHTAGLTVSVWTVNDEVALRQALIAGVDGVATDYPDRIRTAISTRGPRGAS